MQIDDLPHELRNADGAVDSGAVTHRKPKHIILGIDGTWQAAYRDIFQSNVHRLNIALNFEDEESAHKIIAHPGRIVMRRALIAFIALATLVSPSYAQQSKQRDKPTASTGGACVTYERCKAYAAKNGFSDAESSNYCSKNCPK